MKTAVVLFLKSLANESGAYGAGEEHEIPLTWATALQEGQTVKILSTGSRVREYESEDLVAPEIAAERLTKKKGKRP